MSENQINQLISRIDLLHQTIKEELQLMGKRFDEIGKEEINRVKGRRNNVLSALGVALTILLGLHSVKPLDDMLFGIILSTILILGIMLFVIFNAIISKIHNMYNQLYNSIIEGERQISFSQGYFIALTAQIGSSDYQQIWNYYLFSKSLGGAIYIPIISTLQNTQDELLINLDIVDSMKNEANTMLSMLINFEETTNSFDRTLSLPQNILKFLDEMKKLYVEIKN